MIEYVPGGAFALVGPQSVDANTIQADVGTELLAFVDVLAHMILRIESCATWAHALEAARGVPTLSAAAQRLLQFALVYVAADFACGVYFVATVADTAISSH